MNLERIQDSLKKLFTDDSRWPHRGRRLIFWYDADGQFQDTFNDLQIPKVEKLQLADIPFTTKHRLLIQQPSQNFLLYAPFPEPDLKENWFLDLQKTGLLFSADPAALVYADLGLHQRSLEHTIRQYIKFFHNEKDRVKPLQAMHLSPNADERQLLLAMLSVLAGLKVPDAPGLIRSVLMAGLLESDNAIWRKLESFVSAKAFWQVVQDYIGLYDPKPSLQKLLTQLLITHLATALKAPLPDKLATYRIQRGQQAYAFISQWMRDRDDADDLSMLSQHIGNDLDIFNQLESFSLADLQEADTFEAIDQILIRQCVEAIMENTDSWQAWKTLLQTRKTLFWAAKYKDIYRALEAAIQLKELQKSYDKGFKQPAQKLFAAYATELYKFDRAYRNFIVASDAAQGDILKALIEYIENLYSGRFLGDLGYAWSEALGPQWELDGILCQSQFFKQNVAPILQRSDREKVCVIISDAMRYEVATELKELIEQELRGDTALTPQLGIRLDFVEI